MNSHRYIYGLLILLAILCSGCDAMTDPQAFTNALRARPTPGGSPSTTTTTNTTTSRSDADDIVLTSGLDDDGCAIDSVTTFGTTDSLYVVLHETSVAEGTSFFARLYDASAALEDTEELVADQDYSDVCINFAFAPTQGETWAEGAYEIEFFVNGNSYQFADFQIR